MNDRWLVLLEKAVKFVIRKEHYYFTLLYGSILKRRTKSVPQPAAAEYSWTLISGDNLKLDFDYRDESWNEIRWLGARAWLEWLQMDQVPILSNTCNNKRVIFSGTSLVINSPSGLPNRWVFLRFLRKVGKIYAIEHYITVNSEFTEVQFAFNLRSMMNRVRLMLVDNRELMFQTVEKGAFMPPLRRTPLRLETGRKYHIRIEVIGNCFYFYLNRELVMSLSVEGHSAEDNDECALILWEQSSERRIDALIEDLRIWSGNRCSSPKP